jgi:hypothetical protein
VLDVQRVKTRVYGQEQDGISEDGPHISELFKRPVVSIASLAEKFHVCCTTAQSDVVRLVDADILRAIDGVYPKSFVAPAIMAAAFEDLDSTEGGGESIRTVATSVSGRRFEQSQPTASC